MTETCVARLGLHLLEVEITTRCNLNCGHCYNRTNKNFDMPLNDIVDLIGFAQAYNVQKFIISGGEAVLHSNFHDLATYIMQNKPKMKMVVQSNGLIDEVNIETIKAFDIVHLSFEPDGSNVREISVEKTINTAKRFLDAGIYTYLFATVHSGNLGMIDWMIDIANKNSIDIGFNLCIPGHRQQLQLSRQQSIDTIKKLHEAYLKRKILRFTSPFTAILKNQESEKYVGIKGGCTAGVAACVVLPNGDVIPCPFFRIKAGNIYESGMKDIWLNSELFGALRKRKEFDNPCGECKYLSYCGGCRARAYSQTGKLGGHDSDCFL